MPFQKVGKNRFASPSGKSFTGAQVRLYYATNGFSRNPRPKKAKKKL